MEKIKPALLKKDFEQSAEPYKNGWSAPLYLKKIEFRNKKNNQKYVLVLEFLPCPVIVT